MSKISFTIEVRDSGDVISLHNKTRTPLSEASEIEGKWEVDWGNNKTTYNNINHKYEYAGEYTITIEGKFKIPHLILPFETVSLNIVHDCSINNLSFCFYKCHALESIPERWEVHNVTDMEDMFYACFCFNQDISNWNVKQVNDMNSMFSGCLLFNSDLTAWKTGKDKDKRDMFYNCKQLALSPYWLALKKKKKKTRADKRKEKTNVPTTKETK